MNLVRFLLHTARSMLIFTAVAALISGACNVGMIAMVNAALAQHPSSYSFLIAGFVALGFGKLLTNFISQFMLARFAQTAIAGLRRDLVCKILAVPLRHLETVGTSSLMVALTEDVLNITNGLLNIPLFSVNVAILLGGAVYLGWLSWKVLLMTSLLILFGAFVYRIFIRQGFGFLHFAREEEDRLFHHFRALTEGIKELKLHRNRRSVFLSKNVQTATEAYQRHNVAAETCFIIAQSWSQLLFFALIGLILFFLPVLKEMPIESLRGYVITILYLMGPLAGVLGSLSAFGRANVALEKIEKMGMSLAAKSTESFSIAHSEKETRFERLELLDVTHAYHVENDDSHFMLGPINLTFSAGDLVFLVGGNGSGKSTLAKIVTGLYPPETGEIRLNGKRVDDSNRDDYRQLFSAIFSDFYLFDSLLGLVGENLDNQAQGYLVQLHLHRKVKIRNGTLSTTAVSQGQRKRLALLTAYLEARPFYLFDEWAADQDPQFKDIFYTQLLPELKSRGKTVLVITHDSRYFQIADRIIRLDSGKMVDEEREAQSMLLQAWSGS